MDAVISGHAGVALVLDGSGLTSIHVEHPEEVIPRQESEIHLLFGGARDLQFLADVDLEQVRAQLELAGARIDALHLALVILDRELSEETRQQAALELNELMGLLEITDFLERVLCAHPLPSSADLSGSLELSFSQAPKVQDLLLALEALQKTISEVHRAWEAIPATVFKAEGERSRVRALFAREGLFKELVLNREEGAAIHSFLLSSSLRPALRSVPGYRRVLEEWIASFQEVPSNTDRLVEGRRDGEVPESLDDLEEEIVASESLLQEAAKNLDVFEQVDVAEVVLSREQALEQLLLQLRPRLRRILKTYRIPRKDADELVWETILASIYKKDSIRSPRAWIIATVRTRCIFYWRKRRHQLYSFVDSTLFEELSELSATQSESDLRNELTNMVADLSFRFSSLLRLRYGLDPALEEISERARIHESIMRSLGSSREHMPPRRFGKSS